jgi:hypothetical protein
MKKCLLFFISILYLGISSGFAMDIHYCMGKKVSVELWHHQTKKCGKCGMIEKKDGCCKNQSKFYKIQDAHKKGNEITVNFSAVYTPILYYYTPFLAIKYNALRSTFYSSPPPILFLPKPYLLFGVFKI